MDRQSKYFTLSPDSLRAIGGWAADCAERALSIYETHPDSDSRPRAAASAYTHPLADVHQTKHIVGPAAYAALALELEHSGDSSIGDGEVRWAIEHAPSEARGLAADARSSNGQESVGHDPL